MRKRNAKYYAKRRIVLIFGILSLVAAVVLTVMIASDDKGGSKNKNNKDVSSSLASEPEYSSSQKEVSSEEPAQSSEESSVSSNVSSQNSSSNTGSTSSAAPVKLDPDFTNLLLVNAENTLPEVYEGEKNLVTIDAKYINGSRNKINKDVWPYMKAMLDAARSEGANIYVLSPYRSYQTQNTLYQNKVNYYKQRGYSQEDAEKEAATIVARPGTSEHQSGLSTDFNTTSSNFENTKEFAWLAKNAENYGFIMRYSAEKQPITGIIHESWHWRFVGINAAKEMNDLGMCLEEYVEYIENQKNRGQEE